MDRGRRPGPRFSTAVAPLDAPAGDLPREGAVVVVTASYNGTPPDNAARFCDWLRGLDGGPEPLRGVRYTVFGCGDRNWAATYQAVPKLIDEQLADCGATRIYPRGEGDAADDFDGQFRAWYAPFWRRVGAALGLDIRADAAATPSVAYHVEMVRTPVNGRSASFLTVPAGWPSSPTASSSGGTGPTAPNGPRATSS